MFEEPALVVTAHPDDDVIGAGIFLARNPRAGVVIVTDGAPHDLRYAHAAGYRNRRQYARARNLEGAAALALIGRPLLMIENFAVADQRVMFQIELVARRLAGILRCSVFKYVITHPYEGGHPDHDAVALAVHAACLLLETEGGVAPVLVEMTSYHSIDGNMIYGAFLPYGDAGPVETLFLTPDERALKVAMFRCHRSQKKILSEFLVDEERFRYAPEYDFLRPPMVGMLTYERFLWDINRERWLLRAARALDRLGLLEARDQALQLPLAQIGQKIACKGDALTPPPRRALRLQKFVALFHRHSDRGPEAGVGGDG